MVVSGADREGTVMHGMACAQVDMQIDTVVDTAVDARAGERGAALIIVLGLVALISTWAVTAAYNDMLALRRAENSQDLMRSEQASQSALVLAVKMLRDDATESQSDDLDELWAQDTPPFAIDNGMVTGEIVDANRYLNLNALVDKNGMVVAAVEKQVKALFTLLELDPGLVDALVDWIDADNRPYGNGGAEDSAYYDRDYRVKNDLLESWDELQLVRGFDAKVLSTLVTAAVVRDPPPSGFSTVNLNTAGAVVLMSLSPDVSQADIEAFMADRPFSSVAVALTNRPWAVKLNKAYLSVSSDIFMVRTEASFGRVALREQFEVQRQSTKIKLLSVTRLPAANMVALARKDVLP